MIALLRRRPGFRRLWFGDVVSMLGDWMSYVAVSLTALEKGSGLVAVAMVLVAHCLPHVVLAPFAGRLTDRFDRRRLLIGANVIEGVLALGMAWAASGGSLFALQALLMLRVGVGVLVPTAATAALPRLVDADELGLANALGAATWSVMFALGVALGGIITAFVGPTLAIFIDALTFFVAALVARGLPEIKPAETQTDSAEFLEATRFAWANPAALEALLAKIPLDIANAAGWVLLTASASRSGLGLAPAAWLGLLQATRAFGTGLGPVAWNRLEKGRHARIAWHALGPIGLVGILVFSGSDHFFGLSFGLLFWGIGLGAIWVAATTRLQLVVPDGLLGRAAALDQLGHTLATTLGALGGAILAERAGDARVSAWIGVGGAIAGILVSRALVNMRSERRVVPA